MTGTIQVTIRQLQVVDTITYFELRNLVKWEHDDRISFAMKLCKEECLAVGYIRE
jgi:hypothetical protein